MTRMPRLIVPEPAIHVIHRGNNRKIVFSEDEDYQKYQL